MKNFKNIMDLVQFFNTEEKCYDFLKLMLWVNGKECPFCGGSRINEYKSNFKKNRCYSCKKDFSIRKNTIFDNSKISLQKWFMCIYLINSNKKGISSLQLSRQVGVTQKSAWFILHRIRKACKTSAFKQSVKSTMEVDEAYIGGLEKNRHMHDRLKGLKKKAIVFGIINRDTKQVRAMCIKDVKSITLVNKIKNNVKEGSVIITDELKGYCRLDGYNHKSVSHGKNEYVKKGSKIHINTIEGFWSQVKRGINGVYHWVSKKHLQQYLDEYSYRYNTRSLQDNERFLKFLGGIHNKRVTYKQLINS